MTLVMTQQPVILWDFDGTLGYRTGMWSQALVDVAVVHEPACGLAVAAIRPWLQTGFPWHDARVTHTHIATPEAWWATIEPILAQAYCQNGFAPDVAAYLARKAHERYIDPETWSVYDDALPTLQRLTQCGWVHVLLSNHVPELPALVDALGLRPFLTMQFISALTGYEKPHPQAYHHALTQLHHPEVVWMVGDNMDSDVVAPEQLGIPAILVHRHDGQAARSCATLAEVPDLLPC